jgi:LPS export ABC transporter protein LptC
LRPAGPPHTRFAWPFAVFFAAFALPVGAETPPAVGLTLDGMSYVLSRGEAVELMIEARRAAVSPGDGLVELTGVRARVGSGPGTGGLELVCDRGTLDLAAREFVARGRVDARMPDGRTLRTERLRYRHERSLVSSDAPVALRDEMGAYQGGGFEYWVRENRIRLTGGARIEQAE